jgi:Protein of unknown function (DUF3352)
MPRILLTITALLSTLVVAAGCGSDSSSSSSPASLVPAGTLVYAEATLNPDEDQQAAIDSLISKFPGKGSAGERIRGLLDKAFSDSDTGLSYSKDIEPWLGDTAGFFVSSFPTGTDVSTAAIVATDDEGKANDAIDKAKGGKDASYRGHDYRTFSDDTAVGVVDGWVVIGTQSAFKRAVDTAEGGKALDDDERYQKALDDAAQERLGFLYVDMSSFAKRLQSGGGIAGPFADVLKDPFVATVNATEKGVRIESKLPKSFSSAIPIFGQGGKGAADLPGDSWLALSVPDLGAAISGALSVFAANGGGIDALSQQLQAATGLDLDKDVLSWMGDASLFVRGTSVPQLNGALVVETSDEAASKRFIDTVARLASKGGQVSRRPGGYALRVNGLDQPLQLFQSEGKVVLAYGDAAARDALHPTDRLGDTQEYKDAVEALGGDYQLAFYVAVPPIVQLVDSTGAHDDETWQKIKPYLEPLGAIVAGGKKEGDDVRSAFGITVR